MKTKALAATAAVALIASVTASNATDLLQPGQFMGLAIGAPLPEGVFFSDIEDYGKSDHGASLGANIPIISYSTPVEFYNTRLIFSYSAPFVHQNGGASYTNQFYGGQDRVDFRSNALGFTLAHAFTQNFFVSYSAFVRTPDAYFTNYTGSDMFVGFSYLKDGYALNATFTYSGTFGSYKGTNTQPGPQLVSQLTGVTGSSDAVDVDFSATKHFGKLEIGVVGFAHTDINTRLDNSGFTFGGVGPGGLILDQYSKRAGSVAIGGMVGYDFGRVTVQGMVTREIAKRFAYNGPSNDIIPTFGYGEKETRGWLRLIVPLYVAPSAPQRVVARY